MNQAHVSVEPSTSIADLVPNSIRKGVTVQLLWHEYDQVQDNPERVRYVGS